MSDLKNISISEPSSDEVLVRVQAVSKKFCRSLKKSLWYGIQDICNEVLPTGQHHAKSPSSRAPACTPESSLRPEEFWAVNGVSFELRRGECLGLIGHNGAGKTTLLKMLNGLIKPDSGRIEMRGRVGALIALGAGFNPILTGRENIYVNGSVLGLTKSQINEKMEEIIDFAEVREFIDTPVQSYSSGMAVRLGFAISSSLNPDILLLDEVLAVGDSNFKNKCLIRIGSILERTAVIFVSHQNSQIERICNKVLWLERGFLKQGGCPQEVLPKYIANNASVVTETKVYRAIKELEIFDIPKLLQLTSGNDLIISLTLRNNSEKSITLTGILLGIKDASMNLTAQCSVSQLIELPGNTSRKHSIIVKNLYLTSGRYYINLNALQLGGKKVAARIENASELIIISTRETTAPYQPKSYLE